MYQSPNPAPGGRRQPPSDNRPSRVFPPHHHSHRGPPFRHSSYPQHGKPPFSSHNRDRPAGPPPARPNFVVEVHSYGPDLVKEAEVEALIRKLKFRPQRLNVVASTHISGTLYYEQWNETLETVVQLWEMKLNENKNRFWPKVIFHVEVPSDKSELNGRLKVLFLEKLRGLKEGDLVEKWVKKLGNVVDEINKVSAFMGKPQRLASANELLMKRKGLQAERDFILDRLLEFKSAVKCIENYLENRAMDEEGNVPIFGFLDGEIVWRRIYRLMMRECRRLDDGLPIYAHRRKILKQIHQEQVA